MLVCSINVLNSTKKYILMLEIDMQKLFQTNINQAAHALPRSVDADIIFISTPYIIYKQFKLTIILEHISKE